MKYVVAVQPGCEPAVRLDRMTTFESAAFKPLGHHAAIRLDTGVPTSLTDTSRCHRHTRGLFDIPQRKNLSRRFRLGGGRFWLQWLLLG